MLFQGGEDEQISWDEFDGDDETSPVPYAKKETKKLIAVVDTETDPFAPGFLIKPFALGFRTPNSYVHFWGDDCVEQFFAYLATLNEQYIIYAHNGGKFDFFFFLKFLAPNTSPRIINGRLVQVFFGKQEFRDSYAVVDIPLSKFQKDEIDYALFVPGLREKHKVEILRYLESDCDYLYTLISEFQNRFGDRLTGASAAIAVLNSFHGFERITSEQIDAKFREYYFGGRNQCFEQGELIPSSGEEWLIVDRNSMYPSVMAEALHPVSSTYKTGTEINERTDFACIDAINNGALPSRLDSGGLDFTIPQGTFFATGHEIRAGLETGTLRILRTHVTYEFDKRASFAEFVNYYYPLRLQAKFNKDKLADIMYKLILNSSYGKFALNPRKFKNWKMTYGEIPQPLASEEYPEGWSLHSSNGNIFIWERPSPRRSGFYNIATAASITGAARANLLYNLAKAQRPIYCDTDSIICERFSGNLHETDLGGWKIEGRGTLAAIAGKKLYAIFDRDKLIKKANKGCQLEGEQIIELCRGAEITYNNPVPSFHLHNKGKHQLDVGSADFTPRRIRMTGKKNAA